MRRQIPQTSKPFTTFLLNVKKRKRKASLLYFTTLQSPYTMEHIAHILLKLLY